jgi:hypothetical protein
MIRGKTGGFWKSELPKTVFSCLIRPPGSIPRQSAKWAKTWPEISLKHPSKSSAFYKDGTVAPNAKIRIFAIRIFIAKLLPFEASQ